MNNDNSHLRILARGCDPVASQNAAKSLPPLMGNPTYVATSDDDDFIEKLNTENWSVVFFAPGACRFNAAGQTIPGGNQKTNGWTLDEYKALVFESQGNDIPIVEVLSEKDTVAALSQALAKAS